MSAYSRDCPPKVRAEWVNRLFHKSTGKDISSSCAFRRRFPGSKAPGALTIAAVRFHRTHCPNAASEKDFILDLIQRIRIRVPNLNRSPKARGRCMQFGTTQKIKNRMTRLTALSGSPHPDLSTLLVIIAPVFLTLPEFHNGPGECRCHVIGSARVSV